MTNNISCPEDYDVSYKYGFLYTNCLDELPDYFSPWNKLAKSLPELIKNKAVRNAVNLLPELDHHQLTDSKQHQCAHLFLSLISSAYVWQEGDAGVAEVLPRQLAVPFSALSDILGVPPIITNACYILSNWSLCDPDGPLDLSNVETIVSLSPKSISDWFVFVAWLTEVLFIPAIKVIVQIMNAVYSCNTGRVMDCLQQLTTILISMKEAVALMHDQLDITIFYDKIKPFLAGYGGPSSMLPNGLIYEGVSDKPKQFIGGNGAQSSTIQCMDALLGIQHKPEKEDFLKLMRTYMPPKHASFIEAIRNSPSLKQYVESSSDPVLMKSYKQVVTALQEFRSYRTQIVTKYSKCPTLNHKGIDSKGLLETSTVGTSITTFLKSIEDTAKEHMN